MRGDPKPGEKNVRQEQQEKRAEKERVFQPLEVITEQDDVVLEPENIENSLQADSIEKNESLTYS